MKPRHALMALWWRCRYCGEASAPLFEAVLPPLIAGCAAEEPTLRQPSACVALASFSPPSPILGSAFGAPHVLVAREHQGKESVQSGSTTTWWWQSGRGLRVDAMPMGHLPWCLQVRHWGGGCGCERELCQGPVVREDSGSLVPRCVGSRSRGTPSDCVLSSFPCPVNGHSYKNRHHCHRHHRHHPTFVLDHPSIIHASPPSPSLPMPPLIFLLTSTTSVSAQ